MDDPKKILLIRNDHIGDLVLATGIIREVRRAFPNSKITAVVSDSNRAIVDENKNIDEILIADYGRKFLKKLWSNRKVIKAIRKEKFDLGIDLRGDNTNAFFLLTLGKVKKKIGFDRGFCKYFLDYAKVRNSDKHEAVNLLELVNEGLDLNLSNYYPEIAVSSEDQKKFLDLKSSKKLDKYICIAPDANQPSREWPLEKFEELIIHITKNHPGAKICLVGINDERLDWLKKRNENVLKIGRVELRVLYLLFKESLGVISLDTGTTPIAYAGKSHLLTILTKICAESLNHTKPLGENSTYILEGDTPISTEQVIDKMEDSFSFP